MTIGDKIKMHRKALGLTQTELGEKLGVKTNAVSKWECGRVEDIPTSKIKAMAALFDVPPSYLIDTNTIERPTPVSESGHSKIALDFAARFANLTEADWKFLAQQAELLEIRHNQKETE